MTQAIAAALSSLNAAEKAAAMISGNIANSDTDGYKSFRATYTDIMNTDGRSSGGVVLQTRATTDMQGSVRTTGVETDITIDGSGMFIVTDPNREAGDNAVAFTKAGSYRMDVNGNLALPSGHVLNGWQIDENGNLPAVRTITESLTPINL